MPGIHTSLNQRRSHPQYLRCAGLALETRSRWRRGDKRSGLPTGGKGKCPQMRSSCAQVCSAGGARSNPHRHTHPPGTGTGSGTGTGGGGARCRPRRCGRGAGRQTRCGGRLVLSGMLLSKKRAGGDSSGGPSPCRYEGQDGDGDGFGKGMQVGNRDGGLRSPRSAHRFLLKRIGFRCHV